MHFLNIAHWSSLQTAADIMFWPWVASLPRSSDTQGWCLAEHVCSLSGQYDPYGAPHQEQVPQCGYDSLGLLFSIWLVLDLAVYVSIFVWSGPQRRRCPTYLSKKAGCHQRPLEACKEDILGPRWKGRCVCWR